MSGIPSVRRRKPDRYDLVGLLAPNRSSARPRCLMVAAVFLLLRSSSTFPVLMSSDSVTETIERSPENHAPQGRRLVKTSRRLSTAARFWQPPQGRTPR